jgi:hypothetical protein
MANRITERDKNIIALINRFGFMTADKLSKIYGITQSRIHRRLKILCDRNLLNHERILSAYPGAYWPTRNGKELSDSFLSPIHGPRLATFEHDLKVVDVYIDIKEKYKNSVDWLTSREILSNRISEAKDASEAFKVLKSKVPDAIVIRDGKKFAIEVELSAKSRQRLRKILSGYAVSLAQGVLNGVLYYTTKQSIAERLERLITEANLTGQFRILILKVKDHDHPNADTAAG